MRRGRNVTVTKKSRDPVGGAADGERGAAEAFGELLAEQHPHHRAPEASRHKAPSRCGPKWGWTTEASRGSWSRAGCFRHPMSHAPRGSKRSSPSRGSTHVSSVTLQRRTRRGAVEAPQGVRRSPSRAGAGQPGSASKDGGEDCPSNVTLLARVP